MDRWHRPPQSRIYAPCHSSRFRDAGIQRLLDNPILTINSQSVAPTLCYVGEEATLTTWPAHGYGETLAIAGSGADPTLGVAGPFPGDTGVRFNAAKYYQASGNAFGNLSTDDFIVEFVSLHPTDTVNDTQLFGKFAGGPYQGFEQIQNEDKQKMQLGVNAALYNIDSTAMFDGAVNHTLYLFDRSASGIVYTNTVAGAAVDISATPGTIDKDTPFTIGITRTAGKGTAFIITIWQAPAWLDSHLQPTLVANRYAMLTGTRSHKSWNGIYTPATATRDSAAYLSIESSGVTSLHLVGKNHIRTCVDDGFTGVLGEGQATNPVTNSRDWTSAAWTKDDLTIAAGPSDTPFGSVANCIFHEGSADSDIYLQKTASGTFTTGVTYCFSIIAKSVNRDTFRILFTSGSIWDVNATWDTGAGAVLQDGSLGGGAGAAGMIDIGDGYYTCYATYVQAGDAVEYTTYVVLTDGLSGSFQGLDQDSMIFLAPQVEAGFYPSSRIDTAASAVIRPADCLTYNYTGLLGAQCSIRGSFLMPTHTLAAKKVVCHLAADASNFIQIYLDTDGTLKAASAIGTGDAGAVACAGSVANAKPTQFHLAIRKNRMILEYLQNDDTVVTCAAPDTAVDMPLALTTLNVCSDATPAYHFGPGLIGDLQISKDFIPSLRSTWSGHAKVF